MAGFFLGDNEANDKFGESAEEFARQAQESATEAAASAAAALSSETNARTSETNASQSSVAARSAANDAEASEDAARVSQNNASVSEQNAAGSATAAETSEDNAVASAAEAAQSAIEAAASATDAQESADYLINMTATATTLEPNEPATADYDVNTGVLSLGIPKGEKGEDGTPGEGGGAATGTVFFNSVNFGSANPDHQNVTNSAWVFERSEAPLNYDLYYEGENPIDIEWRGGFNFPTGVVHTIANGVNRCGNYIFMYNPAGGAYTPWCVNMFDNSDTAIMTKLYWRSTDYPIVGTNDKAIYYTDKDNPNGLVVYSVNGNASTASVFANSITEKWRHDTFIEDLFGSSVNIPNDPHYNISVKNGYIVVVDPSNTEQFAYAKEQDVFDQGILISLFTVVDFNTFVDTVAYPNWLGADNVQRILNVGISKTGKILFNHMAYGVMYVYNTNDATFESNVSPQWSSSPTYHMICYSMDGNVYFHKVSTSYTYIWNVDDINNPELMDTSAGDTVNCYYKASKGADNFYIGYQYSAVREIEEGNTAGYFSRTAQDGSWTWLRNYLGDPPDMYISAWCSSNGTGELNYLSAKRAGESRMHDDLMIIANINGIGNDFDVNFLALTNVLPNTASIGPIETPKGLAAYIKKE